jgi:hypothetical protein
LRRPSSVSPVEKNEKYLSLLKNFLKEFSVETFLVIGFKREKSMSTREDGEAVKLELWAVEKGQAAFFSYAFLPVFNQVAAALVTASRKAQGWQENLPIHSDRLKSEEL